MAKNSLTLIWPGLAPIINQPLNKVLLPVGLTKIIKQGHFRANHTRFLRLLINQFSSKPIKDSDLPVAELFTGTSNSILMTPCHLRPDRDQLRLFADNLTVSRQEMADLITAITPLFNDYGLVIHDIVGGNWIIQADFSPEVIFTALEDVPTKGVHASLPVGKEQKKWRCLWNEIQMVLHSHPVNQQRMQQGKWVINSVWFWGRGHHAWIDNNWDHVVGNHPLLKQLAQKTACHFQCRENDEFSLSTGKQLWLFEDVDLTANWQAQLRQIDENLLQMLRQQLKSGRLQSLNIQVPDYGGFYLTSLDCWKFWKVIKT